MSGGGGRPRIGLVSVRFPFFDAQMPADFPDRMRANAERFGKLLDADFEVAAFTLIEDLEDGRRAAGVLAAASPHAIVFAPSMAAPPAWAAAALAGVPEVPVVIWNAVESHRLRPGLTQAQATEHTTNVGCLMLANVLVRAGRRAPVVTASPADPAALERLRRTVRAAATAGGLRGSIALRLGAPLAGYTDVEASQVELDRLGITERSLSAAELEAAFEAVDDLRGEALVGSLRKRGWEGDAGENSVRSARLALALQRLVADTGASFGTVNCHSEHFRQSRSIGITGCLGVSLCTELGRPLACTGDLPTGIVMHLARELSGAALYCECYSLELDTGLMLIAAGGEGDPAWAATPGAVRIESNDHYPGSRGAGASIAFALRPGPATVLSLSPVADNWRLAWATGEVVESRYTDLRGPNGMFGFDSGPSGEVTSAWIASGATHHNALALGRLDVEIPTLAAALGIEEVRV